jgi:hypothetical protein
MGSCMATGYLAQDLRHDRPISVKVQYPRSRAYSLLGNTDEAELEERAAQAAWIASEPERSGANDGPRIRPEWQCSSLVLLSPAPTRVSGHAAS